VSSRLEGYPSSPGDYATESPLPNLTPSLDPRSLLAVRRDGEEEADGMPVGKTS
jgi:hypothetical protein